MFPLLLSYITFAVFSTQTIKVPLHTAPKTQVISDRDMSLLDRYPVASVNTVFSDNILLSIAYLRGIQKHGEAVNWDLVKKPFSYSFTLKPGETFAFHKDVLPEFANSIVKTMDTAFNSTDGYESDGYLVGDGVCHMATILNWAASDAGLKVVAPTPHDFAPVPDIPRQYGTAIYYDPGSVASNAQQNLYVQNNKDKPVTFMLTYDGKSVDVKVVTNS